MKVLLLNPDPLGPTFDFERELPWQTQAVEQDLAAGTLLDAMAAGDPYLRDVAERVLMGGSTTAIEILYRQQNLADCLAQPGAIRELYTLAVEAAEVPRQARFFWFRDTPDSLVKKAVGILTALFEVLSRVRRLAETRADAFGSAGFTRLFAMLRDELDDAYLAEVRAQLETMRFGEGTLVSASLGPGNRSTGYTLHQAPHRGLLERLASARARDSFTIPARDEHGADSVAAIRGRGIALVADALAQATDHVAGFCHQLRAELGFLVGCLNLHEALAARGLAVCMPEPIDPAVPPATAVRGLYDPVLGFHLGHPPVRSDLTVDGQRLVIVTGANQGGKSTFLRGIGLAQLMLSAGMFVCADTYRDAPAAAVFTHFRRAEDSTMTRGKLEEELQRMSEIVDHITPAALLLCNESFASTNEREASQIARHVTDALTTAGVRVVFVTHLYEFAARQKADGGAVRFLRAQRLADGGRSYRLVPGEPEPRVHARDSWERVFGSPSERRVVTTIDRGEG